MPTAEMWAMVAVRPGEGHKDHMIEVRDERPLDRPGVRAVNRMAFGGSDEIHLIDRLWKSGDVILSLVAVDRQRVVGHILFSHLPIESAGRTIRAAALAPIAVAPDRQHQRIGSRLVTDGLDACRDRGIEAVVVLGHADFYIRFGFSAITAERLQAPFSGPNFMATELVPGALAIDTGTARYPAAFGLDSP
jgi:putative acetyltransferase